MLPPVRYESFYRTPDNAWWRGLISAVGTLVGFFVLSIVFGILALIVMAIGDPNALASLSEGSIAFTPLTFLLMALLPIGLSGLVPFAFHRWLHRQPFGALISVTGRTRWGWMGLSLAVFAVLFAVYMLISWLVEPSKVSGEVSLTPTVVGYLVVIVLFVPFQAAAEELIFRGLMPRAISSWIPSARWGMIVGVVVSTCAFASAHFAADPWLVVYYLAFGFSMAWLTHVTGGLEAPIVMHAVNNTVMFALTALTGQMDSSFDRQVGVGGPFMLVAIIGYPLMAGALVLLAKMRKLPAEGAPTPLLSPESAAKHYGGGQAPAELGGHPSPAAGAAHPKPTANPADPAPSANPAHPAPGSEHGAQAGHAAPAGDGLGGYRGYSSNPADPGSAARH